MTKRTNKEWALWYAGLGLAVFPLSTPDGKGGCSCMGRTKDCKPGKHPRTANGVKDATTDHKIIERWFTQWPNANIGIATGRLSNIGVLDLDEGGLASLKEMMAEYGKIPLTAISKTGSGGCHMFFRYEEGMKNRTRFKPGLDFRGEGGYVVVPPSIHSTGKTYTWIKSNSMEEIAPARIPDWLLELVLTRQKLVLSTGKEAVKSSQVKEGTRNDTVFRKACSLITLGYGRLEVRQKLENFNIENCKPPLPQLELEQILDSAMRYEKRFPVIQINRPIQVIAEQAIGSLLELNHLTPTIFQAGGSLIRLKTSSDNTLKPEPLTEQTLLYQLARSAKWVKEAKNGELQLTNPKVSIAKDILSATKWPFPQFNGIITAPVFSQTGTITTTNGYNDETGYWYEPNDLEIPAVPASPSSREIKRARHLLSNELLGDFPFKDSFSKANVLSAIILPFAKRLIDGPTPLYLITAPSAGTGKSLLASIISIIFLGKEAKTITECDNDEEWRKRLTAIFPELPHILILDNLNKKLQSANLAKAITSTTWDDRVLGTSGMISVPIQTMWLATGNNVKLSNEISRRCILIRMIPSEEKPWERVGFKHPELRAWVAENRSRIVLAILTLIQAWVSKGKPLGQKSLGSFETWAKVIGGILEVANIPGFLGNSKELYAQAEDELSLWKPFVRAWAIEFKSKEVTIKELQDMASRRELLDEILQGKNPQSQRTILGQKLAKWQDKVIGKVQVHFVREDSHTSSKVYRLKRARNN